MKNWFLKFEFPRETTSICAGLSIGLGIWISTHSYLMKHCRVILLGFEGYNLKGLLCRYLVGLAFGQVGSDNNEFILVGVGQRVGLDYYF